MSLFFRQTVPSEQRHRDVRVNGLFTFLKFTDFRERKEGRGGERERESVICCFTCIHWLIFDF